MYSLSNRFKKAFKEANGIKVPYEIVEKRPGDIAECYADVYKAERDSLAS